MNPELRTKYEVVIGIETHVQLATKTKLFCGCDNDSRDVEPNIHVCQTCLGLPGALPVLNKRAVELALRTGLALNAEYPDNYHTKFDRKNYFYPDLPKGYQITQFDEPIVPGGYLDIVVDGQMKRIGITRAHLEDDAGKLTHPEGADYSLVDLNRAGTPLLEIVSEPDMRSAVEAKAYAQELFNVVRYAGVSDANLYYGNMRFDVNVSVRLVGAPEFGTRTETKNMNSFRAIERAIEYEIRRQIVLVEHGDKVRQETRGWDEAKQETYAMRSKEDADEYRYFPEPDLPPLVITREMIEAQRSELGLLPNDVREKLRAAGIASREAEVLVSDPSSARIWQEVNRLSPSDSRFALNWLIGDAVKIAEETSTALSDSGISESSIVMVSGMVSDGKLSNTNAKLLMRSLWEQGIGLGENKPGLPDGVDWILQLAETKGFLQQSDEGELGKIVDEVIAANPQAVADYKFGNERAFGALVGQSMKATQGKGNPPLINKLLHERLD